MSTSKHQIALSGVPSAPYVVSYEVLMAGESVPRAFKVKRETAINFSKRHNAPMPKESTQNE